VSLLFELRRSPWLTRALFRVRVPRRTRQAHWDFGTLLLRRTLARQLRPGARVLEVGAGEAGLLSVWLRLRGVDVVATDVAADAVDGARLTAEANGVSLDARCCDLLPALTPGESFDLVFFNPPYVPSGVGEDARLSQDEPQRVWDGGPDGTAVIERFLEQCGRLPATTKVLLVFNGRLVDPGGVRARAEAHGLRCLRVHRARVGPARLLELAPGKSG
jgi:methylase of polypeptide subunit release factors